jgi:hypothetical protein
MNGPLIPLPGTDCKEVQCQVGINWTARRAFWRAEAARARTDWRGILERLRQAVPAVDAYDGITGTFAEACKRADTQACPRPDPEPILIVAHHGVPSGEQLQAEYEQTIRRQHDRYGPAKSTLIAAELLMQQNDPKRLDAWLLDHSRAERAAIVARIRGKQ